MGATAQDRYETTGIADGVYQFRWMFHNAMFVSTDDGVVVFDTLGVDAARQLAAEIQRTAPGSPLAGIVDSHSAADHGAVTASVAVSPHALPDSVDPSRMVLVVGAAEFVARSNGQ